MFSGRGPFSRGTQARLSLGVYGKLPLSKEFLRIGCADGAGHAFYTWVNEGFDAAVRRSGSRDVDVGDWRWLFAPEGFKECVLATVRTSTDHGGLRSFPFICFVCVRCERLGDGLSGRVSAARNLWEQLEAADEVLSKAPDLHAFKETQGAWEIHDDPNAELDLASFEWAVLEPDIAEQASAFHEFIGAATVLDSARIPGARLPALRIPIHTGLPAFEQTVAALEALSTGRPALVERPALSVAISGPSTTKGGSAWLVARPPRPSDFSVMTTGASGAFHPDPGGEMAKVEIEARSEFAERFRSVLGAPEATLNTLAAFELQRRGDMR